jgi:hypothetical protein
MFPVTLRPGVTVEEFEPFLEEEWVETMLEPGARSYVLKGVQGVEVGRYQLVIEFDRVETRNFYWPPGGPASELFNQLNAKAMSIPECKQAEDHWDILVSPEWANDWADWELVAE